VFQFLYSEDKKNETIESRPVFLWFHKLQEFQSSAGELDACYAEQSRLFDQIELARRDEKSVQETLLTLKSRGRIRDLIQALHASEQNTEPIRNSLKSQAQDMVQSAPVIRAEMQSLKDKCEARLKEWGSKGGPDTQQPRRMAARVIPWLDDSIDLLNEIERSPENSADTLLREVRRMTLFRNEERPNFLTIYQRFREKTNKLQSEQEFLEQRMEANRREIEEVSRQLDRLAGLHAQRVARSEASAAPPSAVERPSTTERPPAAERPSTTERPPAAERPAAERPSATERPSVPERNKPAADAGSKPSAKPIRKPAPLAKTSPLSSPKTTLREKEGGIASRVKAKPIEPQKNDSETTHPLKSKPRILNQPAR
jgi:hypothetical protein